MALTGCMSPASMAIKLAPFNEKHNLYFARRSRVRASLAFPKVSSLRAYRERKVLSIRGGSTLGTLRATSPFVSGDHGSLAHVMMPLLARRGKVRPRSQTVVAASKSSVYPSTTVKPRWWWRTLACVPYLLPLHEVWMYADHAYRLHPFLEKFEFLVNPFLDTYFLLPNWFMMALMYAIYLGVVRRKELPHFLRFHVVMSLLMSLAIQAVATVCGWMPGVVFEGRMAHLWIAAALVQMFAVLKCMQCSLRGMYADVPFISEAVKFNLSM